MEKQPTGESNNHRVRVYENGSDYADVILTLYDGVYYYGYEIHTKKGSWMTPVSIASVPGNDEDLAIASAIQLMSRHFIIDDMMRTALYEKYSEYAQKKMF